jgi:hypothetical protein
MANCVKKFHSIARSCDQGQDRDNSELETNIRKCREVSKNIAVSSTGCSFKDLWKVYPFNHESHIYPCPETGSIDIELSDDVCNLPTCK